MENILVRKATPEDAKDIATIHVRTWQCSYRGQIPESYLESLSIEKRTKTWREQILKNNERVSTFVAEKNGKVLGWSTVGVSRDEDATAAIGELYGIYVAPDSIGQGIGTELMEYALNTLKEKGYKKATLWVLTSNEHSRKFYKKKGWREEGKTKIDKRDNFDLQETRYIKDL